jgi:hypothetical protein
MIKENVFYTFLPLPTVFYIPAWFDTSTFDGSYKLFTRML